MTSLLDADLAKLEQAVMVCPRCEGEGTYADGLDEAACSTECTRCGSNGWIVSVPALVADTILKVPQFGDPHRLTAMRLFGLDTDDARRRAKEISFRTLYGGDAW